MVGDGESQEGQEWEALMAASKYKLSNLIGILDHNHAQMCGTNDDIMPLGDIKAKFESFGWDTISIDGHDMKQIVDALKQAGSGDKPTMIIAETVKGQRRFLHGGTV